VLRTLEADSLIRAVIFDLDGTLCDSVEAHVRSWIEAVASFGHVLPRDLILKLVGRTTREIAEELARLGLCPSVDELVRRKTEIFIGKYVDLVKPKPGVYDVLKELRELGLRLGIASSSKREAVYRVLSRLELWNFFNVVVTGEEVRRGKPEPDIFLEVCRRLSVKPLECVGVGDTVHDVIACKRAGMMAIAIASEFYPRDLLAAHGADYVVSTLFEVATIIKSLIGASR